VEAIIDESFDYLKSCVNNSIRKVWALIITVFLRNYCKQNFLKIDIYLKPISSRIF
jgi:hypothetical protein